MAVPTRKRPSTASRVCRLQTEASKLAAPMASAVNSDTAPSPKSVVSSMPPSTPTKQNIGKLVRNSTHTWITRAIHLPRMTSHVVRSVVNKYCRAPRTFSSVTAPATKTGVLRISRINCCATKTGVITLQIRTVTSVFSGRNSA